jgi:acyl transferase domain-containing protein
MPNFPGIHCRKWHQFEESFSTCGTGTALGDPIEISALKEAFETSTNQKGFCAIASVKANVGHLNIAAGAQAQINSSQLTL